MTKHPAYPTPRRNQISADATHPFDLDEYLHHVCQIDDHIDEEAFAQGYGLPIQTLSEDDLRFLRDFILGSAIYIEQLESFLSECSDDFWEDREHAYRIVTALLIRHYEYELEG